ncbi:acetyltransferase [Blastocystis sp. subtype 4]|uniref:acetyltransferase n=1 Tax=Blastocystis sp. subtype 4 TaxID=944170 RepID=UPI00071213F0|nr:acetyltransferase [Blastocystis sp. subtype 4]KNB44690.1 acetyltransferase [Blastocystis sp. subtype 4]|eukprot:XP_014528133.1 acetyltransferase [Blastocystis sp. subtype 4]
MSKNEHLTISLLSDYRIVSYSPEYYEGAVSLYESTYHDLSKDHPRIRKYIKNSLKSTFTADLHKIKKPDINFIWIVLDPLGNVVGMGGLRVVSSQGFEVQKLVVHESHRRRGISTILWKTILAKGCELCPDRPLRICLSTLSLLPVAESFYTKLGFTLLRKDHFKDYDLDVFEKTVL